MFLCIYSALININLTPFYLTGLLAKLTTTCIPSRHISTRLRTHPSPPYVTVPSLLAPLCHNQLFRHLTFPRAGRGVSKDGGVCVAAVPSTYGRTRREGGAEQSYKIWLPSFKEGADLMQGLVKLNIKI